jgi:selenocysteine lyase/cysteine desulfurase
VTVDAPVPLPRPRLLGSATVPGVVGAALAVPLATGGQIGYANLDHAASAPCLRAVRDAVDELLPWYASVHRGTGFASQVCTRVYEGARDVLRGFTGARPDDAVVFTRNTTDALNLLARVLPADTAVVLFDTDHHAALLPWPAGSVHPIRTPRSPGAAVRALDTVLAGLPAGPRLVVLTGASNVTGELWPVPQLAAVARGHGARVVLDAAQLAPHREVRIRDWDVDWVALSGHKLYAPFGAGALVGRADWLDAAGPYLAGGGATALVTGDACGLRVVWTDGPDRHEAGSPNVVGVHALATACTVLARHRTAVEAHEDALLHRLRSGLRAVPGLTELTLFDRAARVGVVSFTVAGLDPVLIAAALSAEHGIGVRAGAFCAHIATGRLLGRAGSAQSQAVRASLGLGSTAEHVDRLVAAVLELAVAGPALRYRQAGWEFGPDPDPRPFPAFLAG